MTKAEWTAVRAQLRFDPSPGMALLTLGVNTAVLGFGVFLMQRPDWPSYVASQLLLCIGFFQAFAILHECGHGSFVKSKSINGLVGHWTSIFCFQPFASWKYMHREHHYYAGYLEKDPTAMSFVRWRETGRIPLIVRFAWRSWVPLVAAVQHVVFWIYPLKLARAGEKKKLHESLASILFLIVAYTAVGWLAATRLESFNILPALVLYLAMNELVNLPHHTVLPSFDRPLRLWEQWQVSRSGYYPRIVSEVLMLNFNFHTEHHLYPTLPWFRLRACRNLVVDVLGDAYNEADGPSWNVTHRGRDFREIARATGDPAVLSPHVATAD